MVTGAYLVEGTNTTATVLEVFVYGFFHRKLYHTAKLLGYEIYIFRIKCF
jgi:hypothetical protein